CTTLVLPFELVEVEEACELALARVRELDHVTRKRVGRVVCGPLAAQGPPTRPPPRQETLGRAPGPWGAAWSDRPTRGRGRWRTRPGPSATGRRSPRVTVRRRCGCHRTSA